MRAIWTGAINFGLVNIPVRLYSATQEHEVSFDLLHKKDFSPIRYAKICKAEEKEVDFKDVVKGYEYEKGQYVVLTDEDFERANQRKTKSIDIQSFSNENEIDTIYYDKPYYLEPDKGATKPYTLLREALKETGKVAVAIFVFRNREHIAVVKPYGRVLVLNLLRFQSEIRDSNQLELPIAAKGASKEVGMAIKLIDQLTEHFKPEKFKSHYIEELKEVIDEKLHGKGPKPKVAPPPATKVRDLMTTLKASLQKFKPHATTRHRNSSVRTARRAPKKRVAK